MSGDVNTGVGNVIIMCGLIRGFLVEQGITHCDLVDNGDDLLLMVRGYDVHKVTENIGKYYLDRGYHLDVEYVTQTPEKVRFCQAAPIMIHPDGTRKMVRDICSVQKDFYLKRNEPQKALGIFKSILECGLAANSGIPVLQQLGCAHRKVKRKFDKPLARGDFDVHIRHTGLWFWSKGLPAKAEEISGIARLSFELAFGVPVDVQLYLEEYIKDWNIYDPGGLLHLRWGLGLN